MKKLFLILFIMCLGISTKAQLRNYTALEYSVGFGVGDLGNHISKASFRGIAFEWRGFVTENIGVGLEAGWNVFYDGRAYDTYTVSTISLSGKQYRYQNEIPLFAAVDYYFKPGAKVNPFAGLGVGTLYSRRNTDMNLYTLEQDAWNFALRPQVGFLYEMNSQTSGFVALKFYNGFKAGDLDETQSYLTLNVGLAFTK